MGCSGSTDEVVKVDIKNKKGTDQERSSEKHVSVKTAAINSAFAKNDSEEIILPEEPRVHAYLTPKINLSKRKGTVGKNVNLLIEDNTKVWDMS